MLANSFAFVGYGPSARERHIVALFRGSNLSVTFGPNPLERRVRVARQFGHSTWLLDKRRDGAEDERGACGQHDRARLSQDGHVQQVP